MQLPSPTSEGKVYQDSVLDSTFEGDRLCLAQGFPKALNTVSPAGATGAPIP